MQGCFYVLTFEPQSTTIPAGLASRIARLALHQSQRFQAIPTLSVLQGKAIAARQLWTQWSKQTDRSTGVGVYTSIATLLETWLAALAQHDDLRSRILQNVAALAHRSEAELSAWLAHTSDYQRQLFWQQLAPLSEDTERLRAILDWLPAFPSPEPQTKPLALADSSMVLASFAAVARLFPQSVVPGLLVLLPEDDQAAVALTALTQLVEAVPQIPVALALTVAQVQYLLNELPESRAKAMLRSGLIDVPSTELGNIRQQLSDLNLDDERIQSLLHLAETHGTTPDVLDTALTLLDPAHQPETAEAADVYRSQAEWFLAQYLEAKPTTTGRFQVNARLDIDFGGRPMEVDFLDVAAKIVIELDGHYHFQSLDNYRRDRHKDRLLQQQGFLVLRFLSEDVVRDLEGILDAVDQALATRSSSVPQPSEA
jgi:very-short-patch-repair endonuclease